MPNVTVIVPVYNVAPYIERCARSLFEQTLDSLEILFVDDCSTDNSVEIINSVLSEFPNRKSQTRIIRMKSNIGLAGVRRHGIIEAQGDYIIHCDGDDWVDADLYATLYLSAVQMHADIVVCDEVMEYDGYQIAKKTEPIPKSGKELMRDWFRCTVGLFCHNKLVKRSLYTDNGVLPWDGLNMWEDNGLFARLFYYAENIVQIHGGPVYHYNRANVNAMTSGYGLKQVEQMIGIADKLSEFFAAKSDYNEYKKTVDAFKFLAKINLITDSFDNYRLYKATFPGVNYITSELDRHAFSTKGRLRFNFVRLGLAPLFILLFKIKNMVFKNGAK
ncbi:MAG: glycosyltransferase family 2 protein [Bacteroides sp.]|nr:glycosyltransferase family 2 protein [Bacteroides sp.]